MEWSLSLVGVACRQSTLCYTVTFSCCHCAVYPGIHSCTPALLDYHMLDTLMHLSPAVLLLLSSPKVRLTELFQVQTSTSEIHTLSHRCIRATPRPKRQNEPRTSPCQGIPTRRPRLFRRSSIRSSRYPCERHLLLCSAVLLNPFRHPHSDDRWISGGTRATCGV
jgi:hypothetical protein